MRTLIEGLQEYSDVESDYTLDCWTYTFLREALHLLAEHPSIGQARGAARPFAGRLAYGWMASGRGRPESAGARSTAAGQTILEAIEAAQLQERLDVFDAVVSGIVSYK